MASERKGSTLQQSVDKAREATEVRANNRIKRSLSFSAVIALVACLIGGIGLTNASAAPVPAETGYRHGLPPDIPVPAWAKGERVQFLPWQTSRTSIHPNRSPHSTTEGESEKGLGACTGCGTPPLTYFGGEIQQEPHIYAIFWGSSWNEEPGLATKLAVTKMYEGLSESPYQGILTQYFDKTGRISSHVSVTVYTDTKNTPPATIGNEAIDEETARAIEEHGLSHDLNNQFVILTAPGSTYSFTGYCAFHGYHRVDSSRIPVSRAWVPYEGDAPLSEHCPGGALAGTSKAASHEYAESATDPAISAWQSSEGGQLEISDMCNYEPQELSNGSYVTYQWDDFQESCSVEDAHPPHVLAFRETATAVGEHEATLHAKVYPEGLETTVKFEYGPTTSYGSSSSSTVLKAGEDLASSEAIALSLSGLALEQTYHYRVVATNSSGTFYGPDQTVTTSHWSIEERPAAELHDISCVSASNCVAVGGLNGVEITAQKWDGKQWATMNTVIPPFTEESKFTRVSCGSANSCVATGTRGSNNEPLAEIWDGSKWSISNPLVPVGAVKFTTVIKDVSCVSATYCLAVGSYSSSGNPAKAESTLVERWNGTEWTIQESANAAGQKLSALEGVSCWEAGNCLLVGHSKAGSSEGTVQLLVESRLSESQWGVASAPAAPGGSGRLIKVSCRNAAFCMALGRDGTEAGFTASWNGSSWQAQSSGLAKSMSDISCGAMNSCDIVGGASPSPGLAYHWNGARWLPESPAVPPVNAFRPEGISCLSGDVCKAAAPGIFMETLHSWWTLPTYASSFGSYGTGNGQFKEPRGIAVDPSGNVWVSDINLNRIQKFNSKGEYLCQVGSTGSGNGQFKKPRGLAADSSGNVWVADEGNNRLQKIGSSCEYLSQFGSAGSGNGQMRQPYGVAIDPSGNIWVAELGTTRIQEFNSKGAFLNKCGTEGGGNGQFEEGPVSIAADADGNVWAGDGNPRVEEFNSKCEYLTKFDKATSGAPYFAQPSSIAIDAAGNLWIPDGVPHGYSAFYPEGEYVGRFGESGTGAGQFSVPQQLAVGPDGSLWAIDSFGSTARVQRWEQGTPNAVETGRAALIKAAEATLTGKINPEGSATSYQFEWGTTTSFGSVVPASAKAIGSGTSSVTVSETIGGLKSGQTYYYRLVATSGKGTTYGKVRHFAGGKPENTVAPTISPAVPYQNVAETANNGTWLGGATTFSYRWQRCNAEGKECANISGATAQTYTPVEADVGHALVVQVTDTAPNGAATTVVSSSSGIVVGIGQLSEFGLPAGSAPEAIAAGPDGNLWFANWGTGKIGKMTTSGAITEYALAAGVGPVGITAGPDGNLWFAAETEAETGAGKIGKITTSGTKTEYSLPTGFYPSGITTGPDGNLWFTSWATNKIGKITTSGTKTEYSLPAGASSYGIAAGPDGNLWFTDAGLNKIGKITTSGTVTEYALACCGGTPYGIAAGPDGNLWFARAGGKVGKITTAGAITEYSVPSGSEPTFITSGPDKALWFLERKSGKVARITTSGTLSEYALPTGSEPWRGITAGPDNRIWFSLAGTKKIAAIVP